MTKEKVLEVSKDGKHRIVQDTFGDVFVEERETRWVTKEYVDISGARSLVETKIDRICKKYGFER